MQLKPNIGCCLCIRQKMDGLAQDFDTLSEVMGFNPK